MRTSKLRIGIVGLDHWYTANSLATRIAANEQCELAGVADDDASHAREVAATAGVPEVATSDARRLIEDDSIDVIASFISSDRNPAVCISAAEQGKHLLSIKPLATTLDDADRIVEAVHQHGVKFLPSESRGRLSPHNQKLKTWFTEGRFGTLITASFSLWSTLPMRWPGDQNPGWFADPARCPGGAWIDHSIYSLDLVRWLTGEEVASIGGVVANLKFKDIPVEDYGIANAVFEGGAVATIEDTWHRPGNGFRTAVSMVGTDGALLQDSTTGKLSLSGSFPPFDGWVQVTPEAAHADGLDHLVSIVRDEAEPIATVEDAWHNLAVCLAFYDAARRGTAVRPPTPAKQEVTA
jgi:predicted dehydrogenase